MSEKRRRGRERIDARNQLLNVLKEWTQDHWSACVCAKEQRDKQLKSQAEVWLLLQVERWEVDESAARNHKYKVCKFF